MTEKSPALEYWLTGPVEGIPALLQPVAHALLQARREIRGWMAGFPESLLWERPAGLASPGFHLQHLTGVLDRLLTYARGEALTIDQLSYLAAEGKPGYAAIGNQPPTGDQPGPSLATLLENFDRQVDKALAQLSVTDESTLTEVRLVGRGQIPSTLIGLLVHAAEHTTRHAGQLFVTERVVRG